MNRVIPSALLASVCILLASPASGLEGVGQVHVLPAVVAVDPDVPYAQLAFTVSGPGLYWQRQYGPGEPIRFSIELVGEDTLPDGYYKYELIATPEIDEKAWAAADGDQAAERSLERQELARTFRQRGRFRILSGLFGPAGEGDESR